MAACLRALIVPLINELPPAALSPLRIAFDLGGATSVADFFAKAEEHRLFNSNAPLSDIVALANTLNSAFASVPVVVTLNLRIIECFPACASQIKGASEEVQSATIKSGAAPPAPPQVAPGVPPVPPRYLSIAQVLTSLGLQSLVPKFVEQGVDLYMAAEATDETFKALGVKLGPLVHLKKAIKAAVEAKTVRAACVRYRHMMLMQRNSPRTSKIRLHTECLWLGR